MPPSSMNSLIPQGKEKEQADRRREIAQRLEKERQLAKKAGKGLDVAAFRGATVASELSRGPPSVPPTHGAPASGTYWGASTPSGGLYDAHQQPSPAGTPGAPRGGQQSKGMQLGVRKPYGGDDGALQNLVPDEQIKQPVELAEAQHDQGNMLALTASAL